MEWTSRGKEEKNGKRNEKERGLPIGESVWNGRIEERRKRKGKGKRRERGLSGYRKECKEWTSGGKEVRRKGGKEERRKGGKEERRKGGKKEREKGGKEE